MAKKKGFGRKNFTLMLIPHHSSSRILELKIPQWSIYSATFFLIACVIVFIGSVFYSSQVSTQLIAYHTLSYENRELKDQRNFFVQETERLQLAVQELRERDQELRGLLGLANPYGTTKTAQLYKKKPVDSVYRGVIPSVPTGAIAEHLAQVDEHLKQSVTSYDTLMSSVKELKDKFDYTPSVWPLYGRVYSGYGWRRHPIFGTTEFHRGVDIPSFMGANVKATAKGRVSLAGWASGYGQTVVIDHKYGFTTVYGHNSRLLVKAGDIVNKGQVIAEVGSTGISTGPHLHYEVRRWNKVVSPYPYLNLDIFTANRDIW